MRRNRFVFRKFPTLSGQIFRRKGKLGQRPVRLPMIMCFRRRRKKSAKTSVQKDSVLPSVSSAPSGSAKSCSSKSVLHRSLVSKSSSKSKTSKTKKCYTID